jgi:cobalt-zinc-cadmium efflux system outer membrane protein
MGQEPWTLETTIQRVLDVAPEHKDTVAAVRAREGALRQAGAWPNPSVELRGDNKIGIEDGSNENELTQFVLSQPIPVSGRVRRQKAVARAELSGAQAELKYRQLLLEVQAARRFHGLQLASARMDLAEQRLQLADELQNAGRMRDRAGDLSRLERLRLDLVREAAQQVLDRAEGEYNEVLGQFRAYLELSPAQVPQLTPLKPFDLVEDLETLQAWQTQHPAMEAMRQGRNVAQFRVKLARSQRLPDPELRFFRERDFLAGRRQDITGVGISITVPFWNFNGGRISEARAQADQARFKLQALERDLSSGLQQSHLHLTHLVGQGEHYRTRVFEPARTVFDLTREAYSAGEVEILSLIDANSTYFDAYARYLELLQEAWLEAADMRLAAGRSLMLAQQENQK